MQDEKKTKTKAFRNAKSSNGFEGFVNFRWSMANKTHRQDNNSQNNLTQEIAEARSLEQRKAFAENAGF